MSHRHPFGWDYPAGAEHDPSAPYNQVDPDDELDNEGDESLRRNPDEFDEDREDFDAHADQDTFDDCPPYRGGFHDYDDGDRSEFADPGGRSALRRATRDNPRDRPCPTCGRDNMLTPKDVALGYQCDICADVAEGYAP